MLGYLRLILSIIVMLSHADVRIYGLNPGVIAVVVFYMLAGMVVTHLWQDILPAGQGKLLRFYKDRLLRIMPLYLYAAGLTLVFLMLTSYGEPHYSALPLLNNLWVIPLNYYMYIDSTILSSPSWCLVPPAWSLGVELQAYLILPLVLISRSVRIILFITSFIVYSAANLAFIPTDYFGYRFLAGVFFIFIIGFYIKEAGLSKAKRAHILAIYLLISLNYLFFMYFDRFTHAYTQETMLGLLIGIPTLLFFSQVKRKIPFNSFAGSMSYGIFLMHFLVIWLLDFYSLAQKGTLMYWGLLAAITLFASCQGVYLVESKINRVRRLKQS